jgi:hypothetical protein
MAYLSLLRQNIELHGVGLISYCLMSNHVAVVVVVRVWGKSCLSPGWASVPA